MPAVSEQRFETLDLLRVLFQGASLSGEFGLYAREFGLYACEFGLYAREFGLYAREFGLYACEFGLRRVPLFCGSSLLASLALGGRESLARGAAFFVGATSFVCPPLFAELTGRRFELDLRALEGLDALTQCAHLGVVTGRFELDFELCAARLFARDALLQRALSRGRQRELFSRSR